MLTGYQSNWESQISCTAVAKLPRKFSLRCICSPGLQRTLQWQQRITIIQLNKPYRYAQLMYKEINICIKIYPPCFATMKYAISCECARLTCLLEPRCAMVLVSMVAYRDGWENWAASCLGEYTEKHAKCEFCTQLFKMTIFSAVIGKEASVFTVWMCEGLLGDVSCGQLCQAGALRELHGLQGCETRHTVDDGDTLRLWRCQTWKNIKTLLSKCSTSINVITILYRYYT